MIHRVTEIARDPGDAPRKITPELVSQTRESDPEKLRRRLRGDLDAIVLKALRKDPRDRYGSVDQMADDIRRHLSGLPVLARRSTATYVARKFFSRHKLSVTAAALVLLAAGVGLATTLWQARLAARRFARRTPTGAHVSVRYPRFHSEFARFPPAPAFSLRARAPSIWTASRRTPAEIRRSNWKSPKAIFKLGDVQGNPYSANRGDDGQVSRELSQSPGIRRIRRGRKSPQPKSLAGAGPGAHGPLLRASLLR